MPRHAHHGEGLCPPPHLPLPRVPIGVAAQRPWGPASAERPLEPNFCAAGWARQSRPVRQTDWRFPKAFRPLVGGVSGRANPSPVLLLLLVLTFPALAAVGRPEDRLADPVLESRAETIGRELRCMVCQNQSIEDSDADLARDLRRLVRERVAAGDSDAAVVDFIHDRYGDYVLLKPPFNAVTALLWAMPIIALGGGLIAIFARRRRSAAEPAPLTEAERRRLAELERDGAA
ncbi:cytochrome c-type biogenesis protein CcmH [Roseomonas sp. HJA6]|uniref:Cytochrome c-type biogenesis protein n=1 Tax=Roseomonas alba TaxID=2846776 RepID=A0ABS7AEH0_9PROT|nr:cytochrome c-type biogenesis protein CcmH [Neoroseomonas alba]